MHVWLLTSTTYGTWLPGDRRGFVSNVRQAAGSRERHNTPGTFFDAGMPELEYSARRALKGSPIRLTSSQADTLLQQFQATAAIRNLRLSAVAIMSNHFHVVLGADETVSGSDLLKDLKSYGSRALNTQFGRPACGTWWTSSGSKRWLSDERAVEAATRYVLEQPLPLVVWRSELL